MSAWAEAKWVVDQLQGKLGMQPNGMRSFTAFSVNGTTIGLRFLEPKDSKDTAGNIVCAVGGVMIRMSADSYPTKPTEGTLVLDNKELGKYENTTFEVGNLTKGTTYYFSAFPYSTAGVYNLSAEGNRTSAYPADGEVANVSITIDDASGFSGVTVKCVNETDSSATQSVTLSSTVKSASFTVPVGNNYHIEYGSTEYYSQTVTSTSTKTSVAGTTSDYSCSYHYWTATINVACPTDGSTLTCENGSTKYTADSTASGQYAFKVHRPGDWVIKIVNGSKVATRTAAVSTDGQSVSVSISYFAATIKVTYPSGSTVTLTGGSEHQTSDTSGSYTFTVGAAGTYNISCTNGTDTASDSVTINADGDAKTLELSYLKIVAWATGTDDEISKMVAAADAGKIKLSDYWAVGQERKVHLSAMAATGVGESHVAQDVTLVLMNAGGKTLLNGKTCSFVVGQKNGLANGTTGEYGYMNSSNTNIGGWDGCARRTWCNSVYYNAIPSALRGIFKKFRNVTASAGNVASTKESEDYFALPSEKEIFGSTTYANAEAEASNKQFSYYTTAANRIKKRGDSGGADAWWGRSPYGSNATGFCDVNGDGAAYWNNASYMALMAPFGCI